MLAKDAMNHVAADDWAKTSAVERLTLVEEIQCNLLKYAEELGATDAKMKCDLAGESAVSTAEGIGTTVNAMGNTLMAIRHLYESLVHGELPLPNGTRELSGGMYEIDVYPIQRMDKLMAGKQKGYLHVQGEPKQVSPLDKPAGIIAVSGAGNYSSSIEMAMALFLENKAVIHKPHALNEATDKIWAKIYAPLVERKALAFIDADQGREMSALEGLHSIYFVSVRARGVISAPSSV